MRPLEGVKVLDLTQFNGFCTMALADYGADVVKIERPKYGDGMRYWPPLKDGESPYGIYLHRGKKSIALDLKSEEGKKVLKDLVKEADVLVENFKAGTMEKLGLDYGILEKINPGLVYAQLTAFGSTGPLKDYPAFDITAQAQSGMMDITGCPDKEPNLCGFALGDQYSTMYLCNAIVIALIHKETTGQGQHVEVSLLDALFAATEDKVCNYDIGRAFPTRNGNAHLSIAPYDVLETGDGYCTIGVSTDDQWERLCDALGLDHLKNDPKYITNKDRVANYFGDLRDKLVEVTKKYSKEELAKKIMDAGVPSTPVNSVEEAMNQEQVKVRNMIIEVEDQFLGKMKMPGRTIKFHDHEPVVIKGSAKLAEHTEEILKSIGYSDEKISELCEKNIIEVADR